MEKWLQQVEELMVASLRDVCNAAIKAYLTVQRYNWVLDWPGMIVLCASSVHWTAEVAEAIEIHALKVSSVTFQFLFLLFFYKKVIF